MNVTVSLDGILQALSYLSKSNKRWLADHLIEQVAQEEARETAAKQRAVKLDYFIEKFRTDEISEEDILAECEAVRQEMYEGCSWRKKKEYQKLTSKMQWVRKVRTRNSNTADTESEPYGQKVKN